MIPLSGQSSGFLSLAGRERIGHALASAGQVLLAPFGQMFAPFPQLQRFVEVQAALLELKDG